MISTKLGEVLESGLTKQLFGEPARMRDLRIALSYMVMTTLITKETFCRIRETLIVDSYRAQNYYEDGRVTYVVDPSVNPRIEDGTVTFNPVEYAKHIVELLAEDANMQKKCEFYSFKGLILFLNRYEFPVSLYFVHDILIPFAEHAILHGGYLFYLYSMPFGYELRYQEVDKLTTDWCPFEGEFIKDGLTDTFYWGKYNGTPLVCYDLPGANNNYCYCLDLESKTGVIHRKSSICVEE